MPSVTINSILAQARTILFDDGVRWGNHELLGWYNAAVNFIVMHRPDANAKKVEFECVLGCEQVLPEEGIRLIRVFNNVGGQTIRFLDYDELAAFAPDLFSATASGYEVDMYSYVETDPKRFYLYPAPKSEDKIMLAYSAAVDIGVPADFDFNGTDVIHIADTYRDAILDYILFRAFSKDADYSNPVKGQSYLQLCANHLGVKLQADTGASPKNG